MKRKEWVTEIDYFDDYCFVESALSPLYDYITGWLM